MEEAEFGTAGTGNPPASIRYSPLARRCAELADQRRMRAKDDTGHLDRHRVRKRTVIERPRG
ncbi:hypothetical protein GCM10027598_22730 [Amycolatopsis oliviviridis]|uniref:Uncharacterized protein n=1 Tax=Amycolatopsis oliviviridis TaxID=1471590 RepID=A0ABQ3LR06_9PSEU|nr:hypothetical protein GCM10017790_30370 [Amycolatopsis oliviviridis]